MKLPKPQISCAGIHAISVRTGGKGQKPGQGRRRRRRRRRRMGEAGLGGRREKRGKGEKQRKEEIRPFVAGLPWPPWRSLCPSPAGCAGCAGLRGSREADASGGAGPAGNGFDRCRRRLPGPSAPSRLRNAEFALPPAQPARIRHKPAARQRRSRAGSAPRATRADPAQTRGPAAPKPRRLRTPRTQRGSSPKPRPGSPEAAQAPRPAHTAPQILRRLQLLQSPRLAPTLPQSPPSAQPPRLLREVSGEGRVGGRGNGGKAGIPAARRAKPRRKRAGLRENPSAEGAEMPAIIPIIIAIIIIITTLIIKLKSARRGESPLLPCGRHPQSRLQSQGSSPKTAPRREVRIPRSPRRLCLPSLPHRHL
ncbi:collagen alpha-1(I) chain-like [Motacilla alba alba]|uniref:collagen alpha-1(I) chain-like n=1 Tax=Motacilla alba alba TaxID=1094192 RepID=UPI0018D4FB5A|nr:collagen alpha-1(I) chain-like [Motacilla alba alba]